jgi:hypothetical protein
VKSVATLFAFGSFATSKSNILEKKGECEWSEFLYKSYRSKRLIHEMEHLSRKKSSPVRSKNLGGVLSIYTLVLHLYYIHSWLEAAEFISVPGHCVSNKNIPIFDVRFKIYNNNIFKLGMQKRKPKCKYKLSQSYVNTCTIFWYMKLKLPIRRSIISCAIDSAFVLDSIIVSFYSNFVKLFQLSSSTILWKHSQYTNRSAIFV